MASNPISSARQAAALRLAAARVEAGEPISEELENALLLELERHPLDAAEVEAFAATEADAPPAWHLEEVERRAKSDATPGEPADVVQARVARGLQRRRRIA
jgi:broad specificity phosphatase PhoE